MEIDETIVTDISEEKQEEKPVLTGRAAAMQNILAAQEASKKRESGVEDFDEEKEVENPDTDQEEEQEQEVEDKFVTVKVNGRSYEVEAEKVKKAGGVEAYQRNAAAAEKQRQVAEREAALKRREEELAELERELLSKKQPEKTGDEEEEGSFGRRFADKIFDDPDSIAESMDALEERTRKAEEATNALLKKQQERDRKEQQTIVDYFWTKHKAIAVDEEFTGALNARTARIAQENPGFTQQQIVDAAAEQVYAKFNISRDGQAKKPASEERKPVKSPPRATGRKPPTPEVKTKTPEEIIKEQSKFRVAFRH